VPLRLAGLPQAHGRSLSVVFHHFVLSPRYGGFWAVATDLPGRRIPASVTSADRLPHGLVAARRASPTTVPRTAFEREAATEIAAGHELHGLGLAAVAKCEGCDSVVFRVSDDTFAIVHLSWRRKPEPPPSPQTTRLGGFNAVEMAMDQHEH
jgi:hypothetical protein